MKALFVQIKCELGKAYDVADALVDSEIASEVYSTAGDFDHPARHVGQKHRPGWAGESSPSRAERSRAGRELEHPVTGFDADGLDQRSGRGRRVAVDLVYVHVPRVRYGGPRLGMVDNIHHDLAPFRYSSY